MSCFGTGKYVPSGGASASTEPDSGSSAANRWSIPISDVPELWVVGYFEMRVIGTQSHAPLDRTSLRLT